MMWTSESACKVLKGLLFVAIFHLALGSSSLESCAADADDSRAGGSLIQARNQAQSLSNKGRQSPSAPTPGIARASLPPHLYELGLQVLAKEAVLDAVVTNTHTETTSYAGVNMTVRMVNGDAVDAEDVYGVDSLDQSIVNANGMMNMLDIGGNYGRVSIATFKKQPQKMRIVAVEPVPSTYFLLKWNLWLNGVPDLTWAQFQSSSAPGVYALQNGIGSIDGQTKGLCYTPPFTMMAKVCDCAVEELKSPQDRVGQCDAMVGRSLDSLFNLFGTEPITFLKMDCEGCESDALPALTRLSQTAARRIGRLGGELHAKSNELEDMACKFEGGKWFVHVCFFPALAKYDVFSLSGRCQGGSARQSCSDQK